MKLDKDLLSIQSVRELIPQALNAQKEFRNWSQERIDHLCKSLADTAYRESARLAKMAAEETKMGVYEDKIIKNQFASRDLWESIRDMKTVGILAHDKRRKVMDIGLPMGVIAAIIPTTNPTSTSIYKILIALKSGNAIIGSPHPSAAKCTFAVFDLLRKTAEQAGAPAGLISCIEIPSIEGASLLMKDPRIAMILSTGGPGIVKAAYSSGNPAIGVGAGNTPVYIESSANLEKAVRDVITGKSFDNGLICSSEQTLIVDKKIYDTVKKKLLEFRAYLTTPQEKEKLQSLMIKNGKLNVAIVGKYAAQIAEMAGFSVPRGTKILVAEVTEIGNKEPLTQEKLSPVLTLIGVDGAGLAIRRAIEVCHYGGLGHTAAIHTANETIAIEYGMKVPVSRIVVNSPAVHGAVGKSTWLQRALTLGCGTEGGNSVSDNVGPLHLINRRRIAWESVPVNPTSLAASISDDHVSIKGNYSRFDETPQKSSQPVTYGQSGISGQQIDEIIEAFRRKR
jgi:acetaldehyde dehydrogenase (acetylating)